MKFIAVLMIVVALSNGAYALILHPDGEPPLSWTDRPLDAVAAKVGSCSATVIHPQYVITVSHFNISLTTPITVAGKVYYPEAIYTHPTRDLRLIKVLNAHFEEFALVDETEPALNTSLVTVVGGWGKRRGETVFANSNQSLPVGYTWGNYYGGLKWGTSKIDGYSTAGIYTKFEELNDPNGTPYECALATYDSGCGMYSNTGREWQLIGIGCTVIDEGYVFFKSPMNPNTPYGTINAFLRVAPFMGWIRSVIYGADIHQDGRIDSADLEQFCSEWLSRNENYQYRSDLNRDGIVDMADFSQLARQWQKIVSPADMTGDGTVDFDDLALFAPHWLETGSNQPGDMDFSGTVDMADFALMARYW